MTANDSNATSVTIDTSPIVRERSSGPKMRDRASVGERSPSTCMVPSGTDSLAQRRDARREEVPTTRGGDEVAADADGFTAAVGELQGDRS